MDTIEKTQTNETKNEVKTSKKPVVARQPKQIQKKKVQEKPFSGEKQKRPLKNNSTSCCIIMYLLIY